ncbi:FMN-binding domain-containing protein [Amycolatopsis sp. NBRC 101858]|uniref:FMN-binding protein n=1 Tax=Amycolatopsis sp. NBRC 101858 TaxID=3032200 RepID=UPI0024A5D310|nr:FMN-binding protein [Amycolatopsis sp. NBRC 101858]GLY43701.1 FMN-binding domain-containing protein [Amycolatopsis sp. NBRC 101858]
MKRTIFVVALSIAGFIAVWRFEPGPVHNTAVAAPPSVAAPSTAPAPPASTSPGAVPSTPDSANATVTTQGTPESSSYGTVQVEVTFTGSRMVAVTLLQAPDDGRALTALPRLQQEAMKAQSADIDTITGATETSESYKTSLQAAIDARGNR